MNPYREITGTKFLGADIPCPVHSGRSYHECNCDEGRTGYYIVFATRQGIKPAEVKVGDDMCCPEHTTEAFSQCRIAMRECARKYNDAWGKVLRAMNVHPGTPALRGRSPETHVAVSGRKREA